MTKPVLKRSNQAGLRLRDWISKLYLGCTGYSALFFFKANMYRDVPCTEFIDVNGGHEKKIMNYFLTYLRIPPLREI